MGLVWGHQIIHGSKEAVPPDVQLLQEFYDGVNVALAVQVRLQQVEKQEIVVSLPAGVANVDGWHCHLPLSVDGVYGGAVSRKVEENTGPGELGQVIGLEVALQAAEGEASHASHVHPWAERGEGMEISQLG